MPSQSKHAKAKALIETVSEVEEDIKDLLSFTHRKVLAMVLVKEGKSANEIRKVTSLGFGVIKKIKDQVRLNESGKLASALKGLEIEKLTLGISKSIDHAYSDRVLEKASFAQTMVGVGIGIEKRELLAGRATVRVESDLTDSELEDEIKKLRETLEQQEAVDVKARETCAGIEEAEIFDGSW